MTVCHRINGRVNRIIHTSLLSSLRCRRRRRRHHHTNCAAMSSPSSSPVQMLLSLPLLLLTAGTFQYVATADDGIVRVHKCCPDDYVLRYLSCIQNNHSGPWVSKYKNGRKSLYNTTEISMYYEPIKCPRSFAIYDKFNQEFFVSEEGMLMLNSNNEDTIRLDFLKLFCLEQSYGSRGKSEPTVLAIFCETPKPKSKEMYAIMFSLPYLVLTFLVFALTRELRNLHGKFIMCYIATMFVAYISCIFNYFYLSKKHEINDTCRFLTFLQNACFLATFFWLTAMIFDSWRNFNIQSRPKSNSDSKTLIEYSIYVFGLAIVIMLLPILTESVLLNEPAYHFNIEYYDCWFSSMESKMFSFYGPIILVMVVDLFMLLHMTVIMVKQMSRIQRRTELRYFKNECMVHLKLFIAMGFNLGLEMVSWSNIGTINFLRYTIQDAGLGLLGVFIFFIFVLNNSVFEVLYRKYRSKYS